MKLQIISILLLVANVCGNDWHDTPSINYRGVKSSKQPKLKRKSRSKKSMSKTHMPSPMPTLIPSSAPTASNLDDNQVLTACICNHDLICMDPLPIFLPEEKVSVCIRAIDDDDDNSSMINSIESINASNELGKEAALIKDGGIVTAETNIIISSDILCIVDFVTPPALLSDDHPLSMPASTTTTPINLSGEARVLMDRFVGDDNNRQIVISRQVPFEVLYNVLRSPMSNVPSQAPSIAPSETPSNIPTSITSATPSDAPTTLPSALPSYEPSILPSALPSTSVPSMSPSAMPTFVMPSNAPSVSPSNGPSTEPSITISPSSQPSLVPSQVPTDCNRLTVCLCDQSTNCLDSSSTVVSLDDEQYLFICFRTDKNDGGRGDGDSIHIESIETVAATNDETGYTIDIVTNGEITNPNIAQLICFSDQLCAIGIKSLDDNNLFAYEDDYSTNSVSLTGTVTVDDSDESSVSMCPEKDILFEFDIFFGDRNSISMAPSSSPTILPPTQAPIESFDNDGIDGDDRVTICHCDQDTNCINEPITSQEEILICFHSNDVTTKLTSINTVKVVNDAPDSSSVSLVAFGESNTSGTYVLCLSDQLCAVKTSFVYTLFNDAALLATNFLILSGDISVSRLYDYEDGDIIITEAVPFRFTISLLFVQEETDTVPGIVTSEPLLHQNQEIQSRGANNSATLSGVVILLFVTATVAAVAGAVVWWRRK